MSQSVPPIPVDVERLIVEASTEEIIRQFHGNPSSALGLVYACQRYKHWAYPYLYRFVYLRSLDRIASFLQTLTDSPYLASLVKTLTIAAELHNYYHLIKIVPLCHNLISLACWSSCPDDCPYLIDLSNCTTLRRLSINALDQLSKDLPPSPIFMQLTHLDLITAWGCYHFYPLIKALPNLSHLILSLYSLRAQNPDIVQLPSCLQAPSLRVCVLYVFAEVKKDSLDEIMPLAMGDVDPRIVIGSREFPDWVKFPYITRTDEHFLYDWTMIDGPDFWEEAEVIIKNRVKKFPTINYEPTDMTS